MTTHRYGRHSRSRISLIILCIGYQLLEIESLLNTTTVDNISETNNKPQTIQIHRYKSLHHILESGQPHVLTYGGYSSSKTDPSRSTSILIQSVPIRSDPSSTPPTIERRFVAFDFDPIFPTYSYFVTDKNVKDRRKNLDEKDNKKLASFLEEWLFIKIKDRIGLADHSKDDLSITEELTKTSGESILEDLAIPTVPIENLSHVPTYSKEPVINDTAAEDIQVIDVLTWNPTILRNETEPDTSDLLSHWIEPSDNNHPETIHANGSDARNETSSGENNSDMRKESLDVNEITIMQTSILNIQDDETIEDGLEGVVVSQEDDSEIISQTLVHETVPVTESRDILLETDDDLLSDSPVDPIEELMKKEIDTSTMYLDETDITPLEHDTVSMTSIPREYDEVIREQETDGHDSVTKQLDTDIKDTGHTLINENSSYDDVGTHASILGDVFSGNSDVKDNDQTKLRDVNDNLPRDINDVEFRPLKDASSTETYTVPRYKDEVFSSANHDFVHGLDDFHKFLEEVDPPDELDVGASGLSIQEILMGQGTKIIKAKIREGIQQLKELSHKAIDGIRGRNKDDEFDLYFDGDPIATESDTTSNGKHALIQVIRKPKEQIIHITAALKSAMTNVERGLADLISFWNKIRNRNEVSEDNDDEAIFDQEIAEFKRKLDANKILNRRPVAETKTSDISYDDFEAVG